MNVSTRAAFAILLRLFLALSVAFSPLALPLAQAASTAPESTGAQDACPHHAQAASADAEQPLPGACPYKKGSVCHCVMAVALPTTPLPLLAAAASEHPVSVAVLAAASLPPPEPPPPRG